MFGLGSTELFIILAIVLVLFGGGKLPQVGSALGKGIRNFRKAFGGDDEEPSDKSKSENKSQKD
ncbi:MAG TPA: twin-arginine translocase TatA/TatE family subunit [Bdellovibrionota bacterium]|nr:twin-arginine translocase TatA/TatE family subunit [Bdellovibrionota bacterium]